MLFGMSEYYGCSCSVPVLMNSSMKEIPPPDIWPEKYCLFFFFNKNSSTETVNKVIMIPMREHILEQFS